MRKSVIWLTLLSPLFWAYQCVEREDKCLTKYHLRFEPKIYPEQDTFRLNDTIWFEMRIGDSLFDIYSQQWIPSNRVAFPFYFTMTKLEPTKYLPAEYMFDFVTVEGGLIFERLSQFTNIRVELDKKHNSNYARFAFIPVEKGIFNVAPNVQREDIENINVGNNECRPFVKDVSFKMNNASSNNGYYLLRASMNPEYQNLSEENYRKGGGFTFVVVD